MDSQSAWQVEFDFGSDPIFKLLCDRSIHDDNLASQLTLSRFENAIDHGSSPSSLFGYNVENAA